VWARTYASLPAVSAAEGNLRTTEFGGRRPYRFLDEGRSVSGRWEIWCDDSQAKAIREAKKDPQ